MVMSAVSGIGSAVDASSQHALCDVLCGLSFPLSAAAAAAAVDSALSMPSSARASALLHNIAREDRRARQAASGVAAAASPPVPPSPLSPQSPFFSPVWSLFFHRFFSLALQSSLPNPSLCCWCLDALCAGQDTHGFLTELKRTLQQQQRQQTQAAAASQALSSAAATAASSSCSKAFAEGELAYTCAQCQVDPQWSETSQGLQAEQPHSPPPPPPHPAAPVPRPQRRVRGLLPARGSHRA